MSGILDISSLLNSIYGTSSPTSGATSTNPLADLKRAETGSSREIAKTAAQPQVAKDIAAFRKAVSTAKTPAALLKNPTVLKVLLTANGLADQIQYTALAQKALLSDTTKAKSVANQLADKSWKAAATTFDFANKGLSVIKDSSVLDTVANGYAEVLWRQSLDKTTPGLSNALTFRDKASSIKSVDQILGDKTLRSVVTTALGIPLQIAFQGLGAQELAISNRLDISQFKDPKFVEKFTQRYLIQNNASSISSTTTTTALSAYGYGTSTDQAATRSDTLASLVVRSSGLIV